MKDKPRDATQLLKMGEKIWNLERPFNLREGFDSKDDRLSPRFTQQTLARGHFKNRAVDLEPLLEEYYGLRGWGKDGVATEERLEELGLKQTIGTECCGLW